jgi:hypothetical protein
LRAGAGFLDYLCWRDALAELDCAGMDLRIINLETSISCLGKYAKYRAKRAPPPVGSDPAARAEKSSKM